MKQSIKSFELLESNDGTYPNFDLKIIIKPCYRCNHNCWFCHEYDNKSKMWSKEDCNLFLEKIKRIPSHYKRIYLYFYGGEPTMSPEWEYLHYELVKIFLDRELFVQTQTNMSMKIDRLDTFLENINKVKSNNHIIDICSSYHIGKQKVENFIEKMKICEKHNALGFCFFSTEMTKEEQMIKEFYQIADIFPEKTKLRFTEITFTNDRKATNWLHTGKKISGYENYFNNEYLVGDDHANAMEYRYFMKKYPEFKNFLEDGWNFKINGKTVVKYTDVKNQQMNKFRFFKCSCGKKQLVIDHNLKVTHCNDDFYNNIKIKDLKDIDFESYLAKNAVCANVRCSDGLEFKKWK